MAGDDAVADPDEIPELWGLLIYDGHGLTVAKQAPPREPDPIDFAFLASLFRRVAEQVTPAAEIEAELINEALAVGDE